MTRALWALGCFALAACAQPEARTQIMLEVAVDSAVLDDLRVLTVTVHVSSDGGAHWQQRVDDRFEAADVGGPWADFDWPARLGLVPADGDTSMISVRAAALGAEDRVLVAQSAAAAFVQGSTKLLRIELLARCKRLAGTCDDPSCIGSSCSTCRTGRCVAVDLADALPDYEPGGTGIIESDEDPPGAAPPIEISRSPTIDSDPSPTTDGGDSPTGTAATPGNDSTPNTADQNGTAPGRCTADCSAIPRCGDGDLHATETCDDGANNGRPGRCDRTCAFLCVGNCPLRVDLDAPLDGDGLSWQTAMPDVQAAVNRAAAQGGGQVWLKRGTYDPTPSSVEGMAVLMIPTLQQGRLEIYGGFAGNEVSLEQRDPAINETVLSGASRITEHVVWGSGDYLLDGVAILDGIAHPGSDGASYRGGGMYNAGGSPTIRNCVFRGHINWAGRGGAMYNENAYPLIEHCLFEDNESSDGEGGAIYVSGGNGTVRIRDSVFADNRADSYAGSIVALWGTCTQPDCRLGLELESVRMAMNHAQALSLRNAHLNAVGLELIGNSTAGEGAALSIDAASSAELRRSLVSANISGTAGAPTAVIANYGQLRVIDSKLVDNPTPAGVVRNAMDATAFLINTLVLADEQPPPEYNPWTTTSVVNQGRMEIVQCTLGGSATHALGNSASATIINSAIWPGAVAGSGTLTVTHSCLDNAAALGAASNVELDASPFDPEWLLQPGAGDACLGAGDAQAADDRQIPWQQLMTQASGCLDSGAIDIGVHLSAPDGAVPCL